MKILEKILLVIIIVEMIFVGIQIYNLKQPKQQKPICHTKQYCDIENNLIIEVDCTGE